MYAWLLFLHIAGAAVWTSGHLVLALDARLRMIPKLDESRITSLAWHIVPVTVISVLYLIVDVAIRTGGIW